MRYRYLRLYNIFVLLMLVALPVLSTDNNIWTRCAMGDDIYQAGVKDNGLYIFSFNRERERGYVYKSENDGVTWTSDNVTEIYTYSYVYHFGQEFSNDYTLLSSSSGHVTLFENDSIYGNICDQISFTNDTGFTGSYDFDAYKADYVQIATTWYASSYMIGFVRSDDTGKTWFAPYKCSTDKKHFSSSKCYSEYAPRGAITAIGNLIIGQSDNGIISVSNDSGRTWITREKSPGFYFLETINTKELIGATQNEVYRSIDTGLTWTNITETLPRPSYGVPEYITWLVADDKRALLTIRSGVFEWTGSGWKKVGSALPPYVQPYKVFTYNNTLYCLASGNIFKLAGNQWVLLDHESSNDRVNVWAIHHFDGAIWASGGGVYRSVDNGATWINVSTGIEDHPTVVDFFNCSGELFLSSQRSGLHRWNSTTESWSPLRIGEQTRYHYGHILPVDGYADKIMFIHRSVGLMRINLKTNTIDSISMPAYMTNAGSLSFYRDTILLSTGYLILQSVDEGESWDTLFVSHGTQYGGDVGSVTHNENGILLAAGDNHLFSENGGITWDTISIPGSSGRNVYLAKDTTILFAGKKIVRSTDHCKSWDSTSLPKHLWGGSWLNPLDVYNGKLYIGTESGLWSAPIDKVFKRNSISHSIINDWPANVFKFRPNGYLDIMSSIAGELNLHIYDLQGRTIMFKQLTCGTTGKNTITLPKAKSKGQMFITVSVNGIIVFRSKYMAL